MATVTASRAVGITPEQIIERRVALGMSQAKLARLVDMNQNSLCQIERGAMRLAEHRAQQITRVLAAYERAHAEARRATAEAHG